LVASDDYLSILAAHMISAIVTAAACGMQMVASLTPFPETLIVGRFITTVFSPLSDAALILYFQEILPSSLRSTMSSQFSTGYAVMCLLGMLLGHEDILGNSLPVLLFVLVIPGVIPTLIIVLLPETPKFLTISRHDSDCALASLAFYQGEHGALQAQLANCSLKAKRSFHCIITTSHLRRAFALSIAALVGTLPFFPILQNSTHFFTFLNMAQLSSSFLMVLLTFSCITSTFIVDKLPRMTMLLTVETSCLMFFSSFVLGAELGFKYMAVIGIFAFAFLYGVGVGPVAWSTPPELLPLQYRSAMFCLCYGFHSLLVVLTNFATVSLLGPTYPYAYRCVYVCKPSKTSQQ
uniref:MFS domain-containing protein n=1 Tax=Angiostrongylus cantonensis TaxID=6313 RepID=A0A0K0CY23_ANGCA